MIKPTIHMNGSSADVLVEGYAEASSAITTALEKLAAAAPNARDYYPQGDDAFEQARMEHFARLARLQSVRDELAELAEHVADENDKRRSRS